MIKASTKSCLTSVAVTIGTYAIAEFLHHGLIAGTITPWLLNLGMSSTIVMYLSWLAVGMSVAALGWILWKLFVEDVGSIKKTITPVVGSSPVAVAA